VLAELHEVAVVADRVGADPVLVADRGGGGGDLAERAELLDVGRVAHVRLAVRWSAELVLVADAAAALVVVVAVRRWRTWWSPSSCSRWWT
jgi:hypothetical protein